MGWFDEQPVGRRGGYVVEAERNGEWVEIHTLHQNKRDAISQVRDMAGVTNVSMCWDVD